MKLKLLTAAMLAMAIAPMQANAATATATMQVTAAVFAPTASVLVAGPLAFGNIVKGSTGATATTSYDVTVTNGVPYKVQLIDNNGTGVITEYQMKSAANTLKFSIYTDATKGWLYSARTNVVPIKGTGTGVAQTHTLYAETLLAAVAGNYTDTITITVTY